MGEQGRCVCSLPLCAALSCRLSWLLSFNRLASILPISAKGSLVQGGWARSQCFLPGRGCNSEDAPSQALSLRTAVT